MSQLYFTLGQLEEPESPSNAVKSYESSVALDPTHLRSQRRLLALQPYTNARSAISQQFSSSNTKSPIPSEISQLLKKTLQLSLCESHPYLLSQRQLLDCMTTTDMTLCASRCLLARNAVALGEAQLRRLFDRGVRQDALFLALGAALYLKGDKDSLFALLHALALYSETLGYGYLMGMHALLRHDFYEALQHFNLLLARYPSCWEVWVAIGLTRSAMVRACVQRQT